MAQITDIVLFYSSFSQPCKECIEFITHYKFQVKVIPLDTEEDRIDAMNGSQVQIKSVPSLLIAYADGQVQVYTGSQKILSWFQHLLQQASQQQQPSPQPSQQTAQPLPQQVKKVSSKGKKKKKKVTEDDDGVQIIIDDETPMPTRPPALNIQGLSTKPQSQKEINSSNLMEAAKRMERQREASLGGFST
jgi:hypothetical protein